MLPPGLLLAGRYRVESFIGASELGEVYVALDLQGGRECAVKLLPAALKHVPNAWNAFQDLARSVAALDADALARNTDFGSDSAVGRPFVVSERIGFASLAALVSGDGPLPPLLWSQALSAFARTLDAAATSGIFHGDLKPHNLFFSPEHAGWARISDFGMALLRSACPPPSGAAPLGWAAQEQTRGELPSRAGDVFAIGLISFYALTGRHFSAAMWHAAPDPDRVRAELTSPVASAHAHARAQGGALPASLDPWFARALNPAPAARFASVGEAARAFADLLESAETPGPAAHGVEPASGVAAAVAAPLLFQDLPRPSAGARVNTGSLASTSAGHGEAPRSSRPPGYSAPRARTTEHVAGLPSKPPVALLAAAGAGLLAIIVLGAVAIGRLFSHSDAPAASAMSSAPPAPSAPVAQALPQPVPALVASSDASPKTQAVFVCAPVTCEWIVCDGENVKKGQLELVLPPGKHSCSASRYGYRTAVTEFQVEAGKTTRVAFELLRAKAAAAPAPASSAKAATTVSKSKKAPTTPATKKATPSKTSSATKPAPSSKTAASSKTSKSR